MAYDTAVALYVIGSFLGNSLICFDKPSNDSVYDPLNGVYELLIAGGYI